MKIGAVSESHTLLKGGHKYLLLNQITPGNEPRNNRQQFLDGWIVDCCVQL